MTEKIIEFSAKNKFLVILCTVVAVAAAVWSIYRIPLDALPDLSNSFVRLFMDNARQFEEQAEIKMKVNDKHPIYIHPISYGGDSGSIEECKGTDDSRDAAMIHTTDIDMARMYMDRFPDRLPQLSGGKDPKSVILGQLEKYV